VSAKKSGEVGAITSLIDVWDGDYGVAARNTPCLPTGTGMAVTI